MKIKIKKLHESATTPKYATPGSACFDLAATEVNGSFLIGSNCYDGSPVVCGTGLSFEIPEGHVMLIFSRSGHGFNEDIRLANATGIIDADYRGEIKVKLTCDRPDEGDTLPFFVRPGDRVAQALVIPIQQVEFDIVDELSSTERGAGGFGHTGVS